MSLSNAAYAALYFGVQRARGGVTRGMIAEARELLEAPVVDQRDRALRRLRALRGSNLSWQTFAEEPVADRTTMIDRARKLASDRARDPRVEIRRTSGSSGTPFMFPKDKAMTAWMDAAMWAVYSWHGVVPGAPHARFWGTPLDPWKRRKKLLADRLLNRRRIGGFDLDAARANQHFRSLVQLRPHYAYGYPTLMHAFVDLCHSQGLDGRDLGLEVVISTGEILTPSTRHAIAEFFDCRVVNEYGCTESGIVGFECERGTMHAIPVAVWPEVVDDRGRQVVTGTTGEVLVSDLFGTTFPLLRYSLQDTAEWNDDPCQCGRALPRLTVVTGRSDSFITTPSGRVYDAILAYTVPAEVRKFQAKQTASDRLDVVVVPGRGFHAERTPIECQQRWEKALGAGMSVKVKAVDDIPPEPSGKLRYFIPMESDDC